MTDKSNETDKKNSAVEKVESLSKRGADETLNGEIQNAERERLAVERAREREENKKREDREREKRLIYEKQASFRRKEERAKRRAEDRERRARFREEKRKTRRSRGLGGWIATVVALSCTSLIFGSLLAFTLFSDRIQIGEPISTNPDAQRAYYDFVGYVDNMDTNMSKFFVSSDEEGRQKILGELAVQSNLADASLAQLPMKDESKYLTSKYINQVGDYAKYLNNRLIEGHTLTEEDYSGLKKLQTVNFNLKKSLNGLNLDMAEGYDFSTLTSGIDGDLITERFNDMEKSAKDYPEMIYDGPFSDGLDAVKPKGLNYEKVTENEAIARFNELFTFYEVQNVKVIGKSENGKIETFNVRGDIKEGGEAYAQFSLNGGKLVLFNAYRDCKNEVYGEEECLETAKKFLKSAGFENMTCVWEYSAGNIMHYNFVYEDGGVLVYPDMVKVNVCRETCRVSGVDADAYYMNHTERSYGNSIKREEEARAKLNENLEVTSVRSAVIPVGNGKEKPAYEYIATFDGETYYVYIDAETLKQADIFKVVETAEGKLLI